MKLLKLVSTIITAVAISSTANATIINTLSGVEYEWMELTESLGLNRDQVEARLVDSNDVLFGYEYASRDLVESLYLSYIPLTEVSDGYAIDDPAYIIATQNFMDDFGVTGFEDRYFEPITEDGRRLYVSNRYTTGGILGLESECLGIEYSCYAGLRLFTSDDSQMVVTYNYFDNFDASDGIIGIPDSSSSPPGGSFLVRVSEVPIPPSVWLFGSGLIGLVGFARRKKA